MAKIKFPVSGSVAPGFEPVQKAFENNFLRHGEAGAALHIMVHGQPVVDLWGGSSDLERTRAWSPDTLVNVWSATKGWVALAMHILADQGLLDFNAPVANYWPEFAENGKEKVLVRHLLTHTSGLPAPSMKVADEALYDWPAMIHALEKSELFWQPGEKMGYHAASFGWLTGEVLRRITGQTIGAFIKNQIAQPLNADIWIGLSPDQIARTADTLPPDWLGRRIFKYGISSGGKLKTYAFQNPPRPFSAVNSPRWREAEIPSSNGHASARGLAQAYNVLALGGRAGGVRLLSEAAVDLAGRQQIYARDLIAGVMTRRTLGFMLPNPELGDPRPLSVFGHMGMGGSIGFADPQHRLAMGYVMNQMVIGIDTRYIDLCKALYKVLDREEKKGGS